MSSVCALITSPHGQFTAFAVSLPLLFVPKMIAIALWCIFGIILANSMSFKIYLTGSVTVELDGRVAVEERQFRGKQGRLVFAYLVCQRARAVSREELVDLLWPDGPAASWEIALSAVRSRIRHLISNEPLQDSGASLSRGSKSVPVAAAVGHMGRHRGGSRGHRAGGNRVEGR